MCLSIAVDYPDHVLSKGEYLGYQWVVTFNHLGVRCGYMRVLEGHPWHGQDYFSEVFENVKVHGGLTFSDADKPCKEEGADTGWWIGFDCGHAGDLPDPAFPRQTNILQEVAITNSQVRCQTYVEAECMSLCKQAAEAASPSSSDHF